MNTNEKQDDYDSPWKNMLDAYFEDFMFFSSLRSQTEWIGKEDINYLDNEQRKNFMREAANGMMSSTFSFL